MSSLPPHVLVAASVVIVQARYDIMNTIWWGWLYFLQSREQADKSYEISVTLPGKLDTCSMGRVNANSLPWWRMTFAPCTLLWTISVSFSASQLSASAMLKKWNPPVFSSNMNTLVLLSRAGPLASNLVTVKAHTSTCTLYLCLEMLVIWCMLNFDTLSGVEWGESWTERVKGHFVTLIYVYI